MRRPVRAPCVTFIEIALDLDPDPCLLTRDSIRCSDTMGEPRVSLLRCFALTRHLRCVLGAVGRAIPARSLRNLRIGALLPQGANDDTNGARVELQPAMQLVRLQSIAARAIEPGVIFAEPSPNAVLLPRPHVACLPFSSGVRGVSVYQLDGARVPRTVLRSWLVSTVDTVARAGPSKVPLPGSH